MSAPAPVPVPYVTDYGPMTGRGEVEAHVLATMAHAIPYYVAAYERAYGLAPRSIPLPPTQESVHGGIDFDTWDSSLAPEVIAVVQPTGDVERFPDEGYGQWFRVEVGAVVYVEGSQDGARRLADAYGSMLQALLVEQGAFGLALNGTDAFATRTRLIHAGAASFLEETVRDVVREVVTIETFVLGLANDLLGPRTLTGDPYANPLLWPPANKVNIHVTTESPDGVPGQSNDVVIDGTFVPTRITYD